MPSRHDPREALVSCLMVTQPGPTRLPHLLRSLEGYRRQTHGRTELVVVVDRTDAAARDALRQHLSPRHREDVRLVALEAEHPLGFLRNIAVAHARGDVLCQWDDDDLQHPERVARQLAAMTAAGARACYLQDVMQYVVGERVLYWTNWRATPTGAHPGTMMCAREAMIRYPEAGPAARLGEDTVALAALRERCVVHALAGWPHLMLYVTHGSNTFPADHHRMLARRLGISRALLLRREAELRRGLRDFDLGTGPVAVMGPNGLAFTLRAGPGDD